MNFNINETIGFTLTPFGKTIWLQHEQKLRDELGRSYTEDFPIDIPPTKMQLWCFMELFGPYMGFGHLSIIENNNIIIPSPLERLAEGAE